MSIHSFIVNNAAFFLVHTKPPQIYSEDNLTF